MQYLLILLLVLTCSCQSEPRYTYIPGQGFTQTLMVSPALPKNRDLRVGEWLELKATRTTGPWQRVKKSEDHAPGCRWTEPPPDIENEMQSSVRWHVDTKDCAVFNIPGLHNIRQRLVRFTRPGQYRLWAASSGCPPFDSNVIEVTVIQADRGSSGQAEP